EFVEDGAEFLDRLQRGRPSLGVLDIKMPRMTGIEALAQLRTTSHRDLPVVIFSSSQQPEETAQCRRLGALDVIYKPMDFGSFQAAVARVLAHLPEALVRA